MSQDDDAASIHIRPEAISQMFDASGPGPFGGRRLDSDAEDYIVKRARDLPKNAPISIVVDLPQSGNVADGMAELRRALSGHFDKRAEAASAELRELFAVGRKALVIGLAMLAMSLAATQALASYSDAPATGVLRESLSVLGWVALWRPMEVFLYDWWPIAYKRTLFRRLAKAKVDVRSA